MEIWKTIKGYEDCYEVSTLGRVRSLDRIDGQGRNWKGKILKPKGRVSRKGYRNVSLCNNGLISREIHRLVLETFVSPCPRGMEACHGDGNSWNNRLSNLRWDTSSNNSFDTLRHGNNKSIKRIKRSDGVVYASLMDAARDIGKDASNISKACLGKKHTAYGYRWEYI